MSTLNNWYSVTGYTEEKTEAFKNEIFEILKTKLGYRISNYGINLFLEEYATNKKDIILKMREMPEYNGDLRCITTINVERNTNQNANAIRSFIDGFPTHSHARNLIITNKNKDGFTLQDVINNNLSKLKNTISVSDLLNIDLIDVSNEFGNNGEYRPSLEKYNEFCSAIYGFRTIYTPDLSNEDANLINDRVKLKKPVASGLKTPRAFNRVCENYGFSEKHEQYKKLKADYGELLSGKGSEYKYVISVNPLDYLLGSEGNSWKSCHSIDPHNVLKISNSKVDNNNYGGMRRIGNLSYARDNSTIITFCIPKDTKDEDITMTGKIYRMHCHYHDGCMIQARVYPQGNDGSDNLYKTFRTTMQKFICKMENVEYIDDGNGNDTWILKGDAIRNTSYFDSEGHQYPDYTSFSHPKLCYMRNKELNRPHISIGKQEKCLCCGRTITDGYHLTCTNNCTPPMED